MREELNELLRDSTARYRFIKAAEEEFESMAKEAKMTPLQKTKRVAYLKGVLHDIFLENR